MPWIRSSALVSSLAQASQDAVQLPQQVESAYSDITQRHCDKILMDMHNKAVESLEKKLELRRKAFKHLGVSKASQAQAEVKNTRPDDNGEKAVSSTGRSNGKKAGNATNAAPPAPSSTQKGEGENAAVKDLPGGKNSNAHVVVPTGEVAVVSQTAPNPVLPSELIPVMLPGVTPLLISEAKKRHKRAQRRRKDYLQLLKPNRSKPINEGELFPEMDSPMSTDTSCSSGCDNGDTNHEEPPQSPPPAADVVNGTSWVSPQRSMITSTSFSGLPLVRSSPLSFHLTPSPHQQRPVSGFSLLQQERVPHASTPPDLRSKARPVRVHTLPQTADYQHIIRMRRAQQRNWKPRRDWEVSTLSPQRETLKFSDTIHASDDNESPPASPLRSIVPMLQLSSKPAAMEAAVPTTRGVPMLKLGNISHRPHSPSFERASEAASSSHESEIHARRNNEPSPSVAASFDHEMVSDTADFNGSFAKPPPIARRHLPSAKSGDVMLEGGEQRPTRTAAALHFSDSSSEDDHNQEDLDNLRQQFANFLKRHHQEGGDGGDDDDAVAADVSRAFQLPQTFVKYSLASRGTSNVSSTISPTGARKKGFGRGGLRRIDSLIEESDRSTPSRALTVKIIWGSAPANAETSAVARTAQCRFVLELVFRPHKHHFDARHFFQLLLPYSEYVLDLEAGNRGGKFIAIYGSSELQCLKAIASLMNKVRRGESYLLMDCYCATNPYRTNEMIMESPRDVDDDDQQKENNLAEDSDEQHVPDPMAWFKSHAVTIDNQQVNHHAPGALEQYIALVEKKRRHEERQKRKKSKRSVAVPLTAAQSAALAAIPEDAEGAAEAAAELAELEKEATLFIAEGDEVKGLDNVKTSFEEEPDDEADSRLKEASGTEDGQNKNDGEDHSANGIRKQESIFSRTELSDRELNDALEKTHMSIMELTIRSKYSPEELRRMRAQKALQKAVSRQQLASKEKQQQANVKSLKAFREAAAAATNDEQSDTAASHDENNSEATPTRNRKKRRNAKALHAKRKRKQPKEQDDELRGEEFTADDTIVQEASVVLDEGPNHLGDNASSIAAAVTAPTEVHRDENKKSTAATSTKHKLQEVDDAEALEMFNEFLSQYATSEKIAVVAPMIRFDDPSLPPTPMAEQDAEDLVFLLHQLDYDIVVMMPPPELVKPDANALEEDHLEYEQQLEYERKRWFLSPTAENIQEVIESLLQQNQGGRHCCVALFMLTRGFVGGLMPKLTSPASRSEQLIALTMDSDMSNLSKDNCLIPRDFLHRMKRATGKVPMVFVDTYSLPDVPHSDAYATFINVAARMGNIAISSQGTNASASQRSPASAFFSFSAQPEDGGNELVCQYPRSAGGLGIYYMKRALEGRACPPKSLIVTMSSLIWYLSAKLQTRGCKVNHNAVVPKGYSSLKPYFDLSLVYDSAYELHRNLDTAHVLEITTPVRINLRCRVRLDFATYVTESHTFLHTPEAWHKQLRKDLIKFLYPKQEAVVAPVAVKGGKGKPAALRIKPRPEKALRLKAMFCQPLPDFVYVDYPDCPEMLFDDKRCRQMEKDFAKINEKCCEIQQDEPHGFLFANGLCVLPTPPSADGTRVADILARRKSSAAAQRVLPVVDVRSMNRIELNAKLAKKYVSHLRQNQPSAVPITEFQQLAAGFVRVQFNGNRKRNQQDFAMNYLITGCQKITVPGTTPVSLHKRPSALWGAVDVVFTGNRRDLRKIDRLMRQQVLLMRNVDATDIQQVQLDLYDPAEHEAALKIQRRYRGFVVRNVLQKQREVLTAASEARREILVEEEKEHDAIIREFFSLAFQLIEREERTDRYGVVDEESHERFYLVLAARRLVEDGFRRGYARIELEWSTALLPLHETFLRMRFTSEEQFSWAWLTALHWFQHGVAWDRFYLELDCLQEIFRLRNSFRDENQLDKYQLGAVMEHPTPPSTNLDTGRSIIRGIIEEKARRSRKSLKEKTIEERLAILLSQQSAHTTEVGAATLTPQDAIGQVELQGAEQERDERHEVTSLSAPDNAVLVVVGVYPTQPQRDGAPDDV